MKITADISMYPLDPGYGTPIIAFIRDLREQPGIEVVTNAMSTQLRGEFDAVTGALATCMRRRMAEDRTVVFVTRFLNLDLPITEAPDLG